MFLALFKTLIYLICLPLLLSYAHTNTSTLGYSSGINYAKAHSLGGDDFHFHPRDGWQEMNVTNLNYKYQNGVAPSPNIFRRKYHPSKGPRKGVAGALT